MLEQRQLTSLLDRPPLIIAWRPDRDQGPPRHNPQSKSYTIQTPHEFLLAGVATHREQPFVLQGNFTIRDEVGSAGFFWGLHLTKRDKIRRCFAVQLRRLEQNGALMLCLEEYQLTKLGGDRMKIDTVMFYDSRPVTLENLEHVRLVIEVSPKQVTVHLNEQVIWEPKSDEWAAPWLPSDPAELGVVGRGSSITFHETLARVLD